MTRLLCHGILLGREDVGLKLLVHLFHDFHVQLQSTLTDVWEIRLRDRWGKLFKQESIVLGLICSFEWLREDCSSCLILLLKLLSVPSVDVILRALLVLIGHETVDQCELPQAPDLEASA